MAETTALRVVLQECAKEDIQFIEIETNAKPIVHMINLETGMDASLEGIIHYIWNLAQTFQNATFTYAHAAYVVASYIFKYGGGHLWDCICLNFSFNILAEDINISIRI